MSSSLLIFIAVFLGACLGASLALINVLRLAKRDAYIMYLLKQGLITADEAERMRKLSPSEVLGEEK